jgi:hypothetical protein
MQRLAGTMCAQLTETKRHRTSFCKSLAVQAHAVAALYPAALCTGAGTAATSAVGLARN